MLGRVNHKTKVGQFWADRRQLHASFVLAATSNLLCLVGVLVPLFASSKVLSESSFGEVAL